MNEPLGGSAPEPDTSPLLGPAVPPRNPPSTPAADFLTEPMGPFVGGRAGGTTAGEPSPAETAPEELPWLTPPPNPAPAEPLSRPAPTPEREERVPFDLPPFMGGVPEVSLEDEPVVPIDALEARPGEPLVAEPAPEAASEPWLEPAAPFAPPRAPEPPPSAAPPPAFAEGSSLDEVADRLERLARSLRGRSPAEVFAAAADPLEALVTGYALGYAEAARRAKGEREP